MTDKSHLLLMLLCILIYFLPRANGLENVIFLQQYYTNSITYNLFMNPAIIELSKYNLSKSEFVLSRTQKGVDASRKWLVV